MRPGSWRLKMTRRAFPAPPVCRTVVSARKVEEFKAAIRRKLVLEVAGEPRADIIRVAAEVPSDCLAGEKARQHYADPFYPGLDK